MTKAKEKEEGFLKFKPFNDLKFDGKPILFNADAKMCYPFVDIRNNTEYLAAHLLEPITDELFLERELAIEKLSEDKTIDSESFKAGKPTRDLWDKVCYDRIGYVQKENWKSKVSGEDKTDAIFAVTGRFLLDTSVSNDDGGLIDDDALFTMKFHTDYFGVSVESWRDWLTSGILPENVIFEAHQYDALKRYIEKGIAPKLSLIVEHLFIPFQDVSDTLKDDAYKLRQYAIASLNRKSLASAARRNKRSLPESWLDLYDDVCRETVGYEQGSRIPVWQKIMATQFYFESLFDRLGK